MFEVCACLGARTDGLRRFGQLLGLLYHGCDDVADVRGVQTLGGGGEEDFRDGILTLRAALAIEIRRWRRCLSVPSAQKQEQALMHAVESKLDEAEQYLERIGDRERATKLAVFQRSRRALALCAVANCEKLMTCTAVTHTDSG